MRVNLKTNLGFTLAELMIVVVIIGILTAIALPAYNDHVISARRADGQASLLDLYARMERFYAENNTYATATVNTAPATDIITDPAGGTAGTMPSPDGFYNLTITAQSLNAFTLQATPVGDQTNDLICANLSINSLGQKGESGTGTLTTCWR